MPIHPPQQTPLGAPQPELPGPAGQAPVGNVRDALAGQIQTPMEDFLVELMGIADDVGLLDEVMQPGNGNIEDQADLLDPNSDPLELLNEQQLRSIMEKFTALPPNERSQIVNMLREQLPPNVAKRLEAILRFSKGRETQVTETR